MDAPLNRNGTPWWPPSRPQASRVGERGSLGVRGAWGRVRRDPWAALAFQPLLISNTLSRQLEAGETEPLLINNTSLPVTTRNSKVREVGPGHAVRPTDHMAQRQARSNRSNLATQPEWLKKNIHNVESESSREQAWETRIFFTLQTRVVPQGKRKFMN